MATASADPAPRAAVPRAVAREPATQKHKKDTKSSVIFLRIKRKRTEEPLECLVVQHEAKRVCPPAKSCSATATAAATTAPACSDALPAIDTTTPITVNSTSPASRLLPNAQRHRRSPKNLVKAFEQLTTTSDPLRKKRNGFVFTRIDTMEHDELEQVQSDKWAQRLKRKFHSIVKERHASRKRSLQENAMQKRFQQQQLRQKEQRFSGSQRARGLAHAKPTSVKECAFCGCHKSSKSTTCNCNNATGRTEILQQGTIELPGLRLVDLIAQQTQADDLAQVQEESKAVTGLEQAMTTTLNGHQLKPKRVLNPGERELDESIWQAFRNNDFGPFFKILHSFRPDIGGNPARFQRPVDGSTILMAAAANNRPDVIDVLLQPARTAPNTGSSAADVLQTDWQGRTASCFARLNGHKNVELALRACETTQQEKEYVYDVYCVDLSANCQPTSHERVARVIGNNGIGSSIHCSNNSTSNSSSHGNWLQQAPVVTVSSAVQRWLSQEADRLEEEDEEDVDEYVLESDLDSNEEIDGDSADSNDEDYILNDYPDESDHDSSDSDQEMERMRSWGAEEEIWGADY